MRHNIRLHTRLCAVLLLGVSPLIIAGSRVTQAAPQHEAATTPATLTAAASTGATNVVNLGAGGWRVASSANATQTGAQISTPGFNTSSWLPVTNDDAGAPGTEIEALAENGQCPGDTALQPVNQSTNSPNSVFYSNNMQLCYGYMSKIGADTVSTFDVPWWWRTDFTPNLQAGQHATLILNGVVGSANVWMNGQQVATSATVTGAYTRFTFDLTSLIVSGTNSLAIEVNPNDPTKMFTLDNVDWTQIPPDNNTGIQFPVQLETDSALSVGNAHVVENNAANLSSSALTAKTDVTNHTATSQTGTVTATITPPNGGTAITVSQSVTVAANATQTVSFTPSQFPSLTISSPQLWWPYQLGGQPLYTLSTSVAQSGTTLNSTSETFAIRTVTSYLTGSSAAEPSGTRAFKINGVPIVIRGGGYDPNLFLNYSSSDTARQFALMKNMGLNTIRLEGHLMPDDFFEQADADGILINAGYQCCDAWELQSSNLTTAADYQILKLSAQTIGQNLRNHPSVFSFQWSDLPPTAQQESDALAAFQQADFTDSTYSSPVAIISSAEYNTSPTLGVSGEKEGPYDWVPPSYWYDTANYDTNDSSQTNAGGAWGFDSEQSAGDTVPTLDSLNRFMSPSDLSSLWQNTKFNQYHLNYEPRCKTGYSFGTLCNFDTALQSRFGAWSSLAQYVEEAQAENYENTRAQFEAYIAHSANTPLPSTGTIYWQMNKGWPSLLWELYNSDGDQAGAYFGALEANRPLHAIYALDTGSVYLDNLGSSAQSGLTVESKVYSSSGSLLDDQTSGSSSLGSQQVTAGVLKPKVPTASGQVYFVELLLKQNGTLVDRNVYWLSTTPDIVNWRKTLGQPQASMSQYANLQALQTLPTSSLSAIAATTTISGPAGADRSTTVTVTNTSSSAVSFLVRADIRRGTSTGQELSGDNELQSSIWQQNDVTLFPGESQTLTVTWKSAELQGASPVVSVSAWNVPKIDVKG